MSKKLVLTPAQTRKLETQSEIARQIAPVQSDVIANLSNITVSETVGVTAARKALFVYNQAKAERRTELLKKAAQVMISTPAFYRLDSKTGQAVAVYSRAVEQIVAWKSPETMPEFTWQKSIIKLVEYYLATERLPEQGELSGL
jgi:hypothetical protein